MRLTFEPELSSILMLLPRPAGFRLEKEEGGGGAETRFKMFQVVSLGWCKSRAISYISFLSSNYRFYMKVKPHAFTKEKRLRPAVKTSTLREMNLNHLSLAQPRYPDSVKLISLASRLIIPRAASLGLRRKNFPLAR